MTCIVGLETDQGVTIGGDSAMTADNQITILTEPKKVIELGSLILGLSGTVADLQDLQVITWENSARLTDMDKILDFSHRCRATWDHHKRLVKSDSDGEWRGATMLVGYQGKLYGIQGDGSVIRPVSRYAAIGSGSEYALGAMAVTMSRQGFMDDDVIIEIALQAAELHCPSVSSPFCIINQPAIQETPRC